MRSSDTISRWISKQRRTMGAGPQLMKTKRSARLWQAGGHFGQELGGEAVAAQAAIVGSQDDRPQTLELIHVEKLLASSGAQQEHFAVPRLQLVGDLEQRGDSRSPAHENQRAVLERGTTASIRPAQQNLRAGREARQVRAELAHTRTITLFPRRGKSRTASRPQPGTQRKKNFPARSPSR